MTYPATTVLQQLRKTYQTLQRLFRHSTSRRRYNPQDQSLQKQGVHLRLRRWRQSAWNYSRYKLQHIHSRLRRRKRSALSTIVPRRSRWNHVLQKSTCQPKGYRSYVKAASQQQSSRQRLQISQPYALRRPAAGLTITQCTAEVTRSSIVAQYVSVSTPSTPLPVIPEEVTTPNSFDASNSSFLSTGLPTPLFQCENDGSLTSSLSPVSLNNPLSPCGRQIEMSPELDAQSLVDDFTWTSPWPRPDSQSEIYSDALTPLNSTNSLSSTSPLSHFNSPWYANNVQQDDLEKIKGHILRHYAALRPLLPTYQVYQHISAVDRGWWEKHAGNIDTFVVSGSDFEKAWLREFYNAKDYFDTVAYISSDCPRPDEELESIFTDAVSKCNRAVILNLNHSSGLMAGHYPKVDFTGSLPWSQLQELHLDCPVTDIEVYHLLHEGCQTLKTVSLNLAESVSPGEVAGSPVLMEQLQSLVLHSQIDLSNLFSVGLNFPALQELDLDLFTDFLPFNSFPWHQLDRLKLRAPATGTYDLDFILSRCPSLTYFGWTGPSSRFTLLGNPAWTHQCSKWLQDVYIASDRSGCHDLGDFLQLDKKKIDSLTISYPIPCLPLTLKRLKILNGITLEELDDILQRLCHVIRHGSFVVASGNDAFTPTPRAFENLKTLTLKTSVPLDSFCDIFGEARYLRALVIQSTNPIYTPDVAHFRNCTIRKVLIVA